MPAIDGIVSGIDTTALINSIIGAEGVQVSLMEDQKQLLEQRRDRIATLSARLTEVSTAIDGLDELDDWDLTKVTSGDTVGFASTVTNTASPGTYTVKVNALAKARVDASQGFSDRAATGMIAEGTLDVTVGGVTTTITIDGTNSSVGDLATLLNEIDGITAYTINTGDAVAPFKLVVQADETGTDGSFTLDTSGMTGVGTVPIFGNVVAASQADFDINGVNVTTSSNTVSNIVPGISLDLRTEGGPAETLTVGQDTEGLVDKFEAIIDAYNTAKSYYATQSFFNSDTGNKGPLAGDGTARRAMDRLGIQVSGSYAAAGASLVSLAELGVKTERDGQLSFDRDAFLERFNADPEDVKLLLTSADGPLATLKVEIDDTQVDSEEGALTTHAEGLKGSIESYEERIADFQEYLDNYAKRLRDSFTQMEVSLGRLQGAQSSLSALFAGLNSGSNS